MAGKKGQITLFIIIALIIIAAAIAFLVLRSRLPGTDKSSDNPEDYIDKCMQDAGKQAIKLLSEHGGYVQPGYFILYKNKTVGYTCYNNNYYYTCIMQNPSVVSLIRDEIYNYIEPRLESCYSTLKKNMEKKGYDVELKAGNFSVELKPGKVELISNREMTARKNEEVKTYDEFESSITSPIYEMAGIAQEISNQEAKFCNFEYIGFMMLYNRWEIEKDDVNSQTKIYTIKERQTGNSFRFATRSCALPAGM